jgi:hypothetical protein
MALPLEQTMLEKETARSQVKIALRAREYCGRIPFLL